MEPSGLMPSSLPGPRHIHRYFVLRSTSLSSRKFCSHKICGYLRFVATFLWLLATKIVAYFSRVSRRTPWYLSNFVATSHKICGYQRVVATFWWLVATKNLARKVLQFCGYLLFLHKMRSSNGQNWVLPLMFQKYPLLTGHLSLGQ
jgi:hypothetical protein